MNQPIESGECDRLGEYVITKIAIPPVVPTNLSLLPNDIETTMPISTEIESEFFALTAFVHAFKEAKKSIQASLASPSKYGIYVRGMNVAGLEVVAVRTKPKQRDMLDSESLEEQAAAEMVLDKSLLASVLPVTQNYASDPASAERVIELLKSSHQPDATRKAICMQILGKSVVLDGDQALASSTEVRGSSVSFEAERDYVIRFRVQDVLNNGSKAVVILEGTSGDCPLFFNHDLGNREIELQVDSLDASMMLPMCTHLEEPVEAKVRFTLNPSLRGLSYRGRFLGFTDSAYLNEAIQKKLATVVKRLL